MGGLLTLAQAALFSRIVERAFLAGAGPVALTAEWGGLLLTIVGRAAAVLGGEIAWARRHLCRFWC
ncbi:MAG: hypothetical protein AB1449_04505 [Chloroflexota bacterium]